MFFSLPPFTLTLYKYKFLVWYSLIYWVDYYILNFYRKVLELAYFQFPLLFFSFQKVMGTCQLLSVNLNFTTVCMELELINNYCFVYL